MGESRETLVDIEVLASSLNQKLGPLQPYSENGCIYRMPKRIRELNEKACTPQVVSIGPLHYGRKNLKAMEEYKERSLKDFLERTQVSVEEFLRCIKDKEVNLREYYAEPIRLTSGAFVKMILVDAAFLIEYFLFFIKTENKGRFAVSSPSMRRDIMSDVLKLENQLPLFILMDLFAMTAMSTRGLSLSKLTFKSLKTFLVDINLEENLFEDHYPQAKHLLDCLRRCLQPPDYEAEFERQVNLSREEELGIKTMPSISELQQAGVEFEFGSSENLFEIKFENGILTIPRLTIVAKLEILLINLIALEQLDGPPNFVNDYIVMISKLVKSRRDEEILVRKGIIDTFFWEEEGGATALFHKLGNPSTIYVDAFYYANLVESLNAYLQNPCRKWLADLRKNYFNSPWAIISVIAAVFLLILTFIQAVFSIIAA